MIVTDRRVGVLRALKGAPVSVVLALMVVPGSAGVSELECWTGYSDKTVARALSVLAGLGIVQRHGYREGWLLTARGRQLVLGEDWTPEFLRSGDSSSSSSYIEEPAILPETTTTTTGTPEFLRSGAPKPGELPDAWLEVVEEVFCGHCGMGRRDGLDLAVVWMKRDRCAAEAAYWALMWLAYTQDPERATLNNVPAFIRSRLEGGSRPPGGYRPGRRFRQSAKLIEFKRRWNDEIAGVGTF